jgi:hypothetical protein
MPTIFRDGRGNKSLAIEGLWDVRSFDLSDYRALAGAASPIGFSYSGSSAAVSDRRGRRDRSPSGRNPGTSTGRIINAPYIHQGLFETVPPLPNF